MAKTVYLESGSYKIKVADASNEITLESALTRVTGDLRIEGETTTVNTTNLAIEDNIIELNKNEVGAGVGEGTAGVRVDRGTLNGVQMIYDESIAWNNPAHKQFHKDQTYKDLVMVHTKFLHQTATTF